MFTTVEIAEVTGGKLLGGSVTVTGVSTDTRTIAPGMLFVAIRGESFDGNDYIGAAAEKGAAAAISDRSSGADGYSIPVILVEDSRAAQLALARYHRERFPLKLVGVTGSVGKTSTKDMVYAVLSAKYTTLKTEGNFNNDIGLPRTLFRLNESYGAAVIEMGMSGLGEISVLSKAAAPDICIITNIGWCHIENLKTRENILKAKLEILDGASPEAPLILNGDDEFLKTVDIPGRKIVRYGRGERAAPTGRSRPVHCSPACYQPDRAGATAFTGRDAGGGDPGFRHRFRTASAGSHHCADGDTDLPDPYRQSAPHPGRGSAAGHGAGSGDSGRNSRFDCGPARCHHRHCRIFDVCHPADH